MELEQMLFMAEAEGETEWVNTTEAKANAIANELIVVRDRGEDPNDWVGPMFAKYNVTWNSFTPEQRASIMRKVNS